VAVYHAVKNIARIIRRYTAIGFIFIGIAGGSVYQRHRDTSTQINGFFSNGKGENRSEKIRV